MMPDPTELADQRLIEAIAAAHDGNPEAASTLLTEALHLLGLDGAFAASIGRA